MAQETVRRPRQCREETSSTFRGWALDFGRSISWRCFDPSPTHLECRVLHPVRTRELLPLHLLHDLFYYLQDVGVVLRRALILLRPAFVAEFTERGVIRLAKLRQHL